MSSIRKSHRLKWRYQASRLIGSIAALLTVGLALAMAFKTEQRAEQIATWLFMSFILLAITVAIELWFDRMR